MANAQTAEKNKPQKSKGSGKGKGKGAAGPVPSGYKPRLRRIYKEELVAKMVQELGYSSIMQVPVLSKIVLSTGVGKSIENRKLLDAAVEELGQITGQRAIRRKARKSIATFKLRQGMDIGAMVTLRGNSMYEFLDRLINVAIPRIKDFRGLSPNAFDGHGNYSLGIAEQIIFPEIDYERIEQVTGLNITMVTTAQTDREAAALLTAFGMPFRRTS